MQTVTTYFRPNAVSVDYSILFLRRDSRLPLDDIEASP
jgi:hypothetical protein